MVITPLYILNIVYVEHIYLFRRTSPLNKTMENPIDVINVSKRYGEFVANQEITMYVRRGEVVALLGPNGAGKTTLVKQIYGEMRPDKGRVKVMGKDPVDRRVRKRIGVIPQEVQPLTDLRVRENLIYIGMLKGFSRAESRDSSERMMDRFGLSEHADKYAGDLSGGLKRRLLLACAMMGDPEVLILDEPTTGLDPMARRDIWDAISEMRNRGKAVLLTTHYMDEAENLSDRIYFLNRKIVLEGTPLQLRGRLWDEYEVVDMSTNQVFRTSREKIQEVIGRIKGPFEVRLPSLEEVFLRISRGD